MNTVIKNFSTKLSQFFKKLIFDKRFTIPFSLVLAFAFWLVIMINQNPVRQQTFIDIPLTIDLKNTVAKENGLGIVGDVSSQKFSVVISGPNYIVSSLKTEDFSIYASATEITEPGTYTLDVFGAKASAKSGYTFVSISPSVIDVTFDYIDTKTYPVVPKLVGVGAAEGLVAETPIVTCKNGGSVTVKGPRSIMEKIDSVVAYAEVNKTLSSTQTFDASIFVYDSKGEKVDTTNLKISDTVAKVSVPISMKTTVNVKPVFTGLPGGILPTDIKYTLDQETVTIIGTPDVVSNMTEVYLSSIDFSLVSPESKVFDVEADLPDGVKILDSIDHFTVKVDMTGYIEKTFTVKNVSYIGLKEGLTVKKTGTIKNIKICGPRDALSNLTANDLIAYVDVTDKSAGEHTASVKVSSTKSNSIWQVGTYTTTVSIN